MEDDEVRRLVRAAQEHPEELVRLELADFRQMLVQDKKDWGHETFAATWHPQV